MNTVVGRTSAEKRVIHYEDVLNDERFSWPKSQRLGNLRTVLGVPLLRNGEPIGVMAIHRTWVEPFSPREIELVTTFADQAVIAIENVRLFEEVQARTSELQESLEYQTATSDVLNVISRSPSEIQPVLETIVETASRLCQAYDAAIFLRQANELQVAVHRGPISLDFVTKPINWDWVTGRAVMERRSMHIHDLAVSDEFPEGQAIAQRLGFRTILSTPLLREGTALGAIMLRRAEMRPFSNKQVSVLQTFADQAVIAIENARLFEEVQARTHELSEALEQQTATSEVLQVISRSTFDLQAVLDTLVESVTRLCNADHAWLFLRENDHLQWAASFGHEAEVHGRIKDYFRDKPVPLDRGSVTGRAALEARVIHVPDVLADPEYTWSEAQKIGGYRAALGVPLLREGKVTGVIFVAKDEPSLYTTKQIDLARTFADQAVIALSNVRLFEEVQARTRELARSVRELQALGEVSQAVNSTLDLGEVLETIVAKAVELSGTDAGAIYVYSQRRQEFRLRATHGMAEEVVQAIRREAAHVGDTSIGEATKKRQPVQVPDLLDQPRSPVHDIILEAGYRGLLILPTP